MSKHIHPFGPAPSENCVRTFSRAANFLPQCECQDALAIAKFAKEKATYTHTHFLFVALAAAAALRRLLAHLPQGHASNPAVCKAGVTQARPYTKQAVEAGLTDW